MVQLKITRPLSTITPGSPATYRVLAIAISWLFAVRMRTAQRGETVPESRSTLRVLGALHGVLRNSVLSAKVQVHLESQKTRM